jgi:hypothetical protein
MIRTRQAFTLILAAALLAGVSGCTTATPTPTATIDVNPIYTQAAGTFIANLTQSAALTPSATPSPLPSDTPAPSATPASTDTPSASATPAASDTPTSLPDKVEVISQNPVDDSFIAPGSTFSITWSLRNSGTTTWTSTYRLRYYSGEQMGGRSSYALPKVVPPNGTVDITLNLTAPTTPGRIQTQWALTNADGKNFYGLFANLRIDYPPSPSNTPTITQTGTITVTTTTTPTVTPTPLPTATLTE